MFEKLERLDDPGIEPGRHVARDLDDDVATILEPAKFGLRRRGPDGFFTFLAMISVMHSSEVRAFAAKGLRKHEGPRSRGGPRL
jgi:hypothetical protein